MPNSWYAGSYPQVEESLKNLRAADKTLYWHVSERYLRCRSATITMVVERVTTGGVLKEPRRVVVELWDPRVQQRCLKKGIEWLSSDLGDVWLPKDLYRMVCG